MSRIRRVDAVRHTRATVAVVPDEPIDARSLRVSDAEREHVVGLLQRATGAGMIDLDEFTKRVDAALAARTRAELNIVLIDLPRMTHPDLPSAPPGLRRTPQRAVAAPVPDTGGAVVSSMLGGVTRRGAWDVPARLVVRAKMGSAALDFTEARIPHDVVEIELDVVAGSVELRMPLGARVELDRVQAVLSSIDDRTGGAPTAGSPVGPTFVLRGAVRAGSLEIRPPRRTRWWSSRR